MATRIAVFNHSQSILDSFRTFLELHNFQVLTFLQQDGQLPDYDGTMPDLLILGHIRGYPTNYVEFIEKLRADPTTHDIPILVCITAHAHPLESEDRVNVYYVTIALDPLKLESILVGVQLALKMDKGLLD